MSNVLVTGGSGLIGSHAIVQLLSAGHQVRTTVRSLAREAEVRAMVKEGGVEAGDRLSFAVADLESDAGWAEAVAGCDYVLHLASPFPAELPKHEDELIIPAREGTLRVLRASRDAGVKRVVLTSSFSAIEYDSKLPKNAYDETNWTDLNRTDLSPYTKSKTMAERAAWDFIATEGGGLELSVINPVGVLGPTLSRNISTSISIIKTMLTGAMPGTLKIYMGVVDVRDVADLHIRAMTNPLAKGERFIASAGDAMLMFDYVKVMKAHMGANGKKLPRFQLPSWLVRLLAIREPRLRQALPHLGVISNGTSEKAKRLLGWTPRSREEAIIASAESLVRLGLLDDAHS